MAKPKKTTPEFSAKLALESLERSDLLKAKEDYANDPEAVKAIDLALAQFTPSGLRIPQPLKTATEAAQEVEEQSKQPAPDGLLESFEALRKAKGETPSAQRTARIKQLQAHIFKIQQGLPLLSTTSDVHAKGLGARLESGKRAKLDRLARREPALKSFLQSYDALTAENIALKQSIETANQQIAELSA